MADTLGFGLGGLLDIPGSKSFLLGRPGRVEQFPRYGEEQQQGISQVLQQALSGLQGNQFDFGSIEQQAKTQFSEQTIPSIAERFAGMGEGGQRSSAYLGALGKAGAGLGENLAAMKSRYGLQQQGMLQNLLGMGLTPQYDRPYMARQPGFLESMFTGGGQQGMGQQGGGQQVASMLLPLLLKLLI